VAIGLAGVVALGVTAPSLAVVSHNKTKAKSTHAIG
jgi:hypothetical protein